MMSRGESVELPKRILLADDEHLAATNLADHLQRLGIEVVGQARDGDDVIDQARRLSPDLALLDIRMPGRDGLAAAETIYGELGIPVVIVSAFSDSDYLRRGAAVGVFGYLLKPVTGDGLRASLAVAWSQFKASTKLRGEVEEMKTALENRKLIERAKGLIMTKLGVSEPDAMKRLQKQARDSRRPLPEVARSIIDTQQIFSEPTE